MSTLWRTSRRLFPAGLALAALAFPPSSLLAQETGFVHRSVEVDGVTYRYQVFVPKTWTKERAWPVIFFLHGAGERGSDGEKQTDVGLPARLRELPDFAAVVVMPQCERGSWWGDPAMERQAFLALEASMEEFHGDPARLTLTGLSMGGYAAWSFGYKYPDRFAAIVPVCGGVVASRRFIEPPPWHPLAKAPDDPYTETASHLTKVPIWAFHGDADPVVPVTESRQLTEAVRAAGGNVRYTEYPGVRHQSWEKAYWEEGLLPWMLAQTNGKIAE